MYHLKWLLLSTFLVAATRGCNICVSEKLLTPNIKCPLCDPCDDKSFVEKAYTLKSRLTRNAENLVENQCFEQEAPCDALYKYRTHDGSCNNLKNPSWGKSQTPYIRLLAPNYGDQNYTLPPDSEGKEKPLVRVLSTTFFPDKGFDDDQATLMTMQWGQVIAHDTLISFPQGLNEGCCGVSEEQLDKSCLPIKIPADDQFYGQFNVTCMEKKRNVITTLNYCCKKGPAQQINSNTHIIDGSLIYGSNSDRANKLREFKNGRLKNQSVNKGNEFLPNVATTKIVETCEATDRNECYVAGDDRVDQHPQLTALQVLFLREHNRIATELQKINPHWDDETLYQETRAIVIAIIQHITYQDWLTLYVGEQNMKKHNLKPTGLARTKYKADIKPIIFNSFSSAVYRFPHSGIQGLISKVNIEGEVEDREEISEWMNRPCILTKYNHFDQFLLGLVFQPMQSFGDHFTRKMTTKMFNFPHPFGQDLAAIDIIRGRDHGLAPYIDYLEICTGHKVKTFDDLKKYINEPKIEKLKKAYKNVKDIDLFVGAAMEKMVPKTRLGPTNLCITVEQFYRLKWGDRFWYEVEDQPHTLTYNQMLEINKITLARLLCDNGDNITKITKNVFLTRSTKNPIVDCNKIKSIDLSHWTHWLKLKNLGTFS